MNLRRNVKVALQSTGLYPVARALKRRFDPAIKQVKQAETDLYRRFISPGDLVFDVGVNVGQKSEIFLGLGANVVGVEPNPNCYSAIDYQFGRNPRFQLEPVALGAVEGEAQLHFVGSDATASLRADWPHLRVDDSPVEAATVKVDTLDHLIAKHGAPKFCKVDVEGFELEVFRGLSTPLPLVTFEYFLDERAPLIACLAHLSSLGPIELNANPMESGDLVFDRWLPIEQFLASPRLPREADCWVRTARQA